MIKTLRRDAQCSARNRRGCEAALGGREMRASVVRMERDVRAQESSLRETVSKVRAPPRVEVPNRREPNITVGAGNDREGGLANQDPRERGRRCDVRWP